MSMEIAGSYHHSGFKSLSPLAQSVREYFSYGPTGAYQDPEAALAADGAAEEFLRAVRAGDWGDEDEAPDLADVEAAIREALA